MCHLECVQLLIVDHICAINEANDTVVHIVNSEVTYLGFWRIKFKNNSSILTFRGVTS